MHEEITCPLCAGRGRRHDGSRCGICHGSGFDPEITDGCAGGQGRSSAEIASIGELLCVLAFVAIAAAAAWGAVLWVMV